MRQLIIFIIENADYDTVKRWLIGEEDESVVESEMVDGDGVSKQVEQFLLGNQIDTFSKHGASLDFFGAKEDAARHALKLSKLNKPLANVFYVDEEDEIWVPLMLPDCFNPIGKSCIQPINLPSITTKGVPIYFEFDLKPPVFIPMVFGVADFELP